MELTALTLVVLVHALLAVAAIVMACAMAMTGRMRFSPTLITCLLVVWIPLAGPLAVFVMAAFEARRPKITADTDA